MLFGDIGGEILGEDETVARAQPARTPGKGAPRAAAEIAVERDLDRCRAAAPNEPRRDHLGVVEDEKIAGRNNAGRSPICRSCEPPEAGISSRRAASRGSHG